MANSPAGKPSESPPPFDPNVTTPRDLRDQPLSVIKTELPALAEALGVTPAELFRSLAGQRETATGGVQERLAQVEGGAMGMTDISAMCCHSDSW